MPRDIYSFVKVRRDETDLGMICTALGIASLACLGVLITASFIGGGALPSIAGAIGYLSFTVSLAALYISYRLRNDTNAYGRMVTGCIYICLISAAAHLIVFLTGCFALISQTS